MRQKRYAITRRPRDPVWHGLLANRPVIKDGMIEVPQGPGFDLVLDPEIIRKYRVDR